MTVIYNDGITEILQYPGNITVTLPAPGSNQATINANRVTILANLQTLLGELLTWIAANPTGAILTGPQTLVLAQMLVALFDVAMGTFSSVTGT